MYIEREALIADLRGSYNDLMRIYDKLNYPDEREICKGQLSTFLECIMRVREAPAAEVAPVVHGRWINEVELHPELYGWVPLNNVVCSVCNKSNGIEKHYCPNCGAKMDGGNDAK